MHPRERLRALGLVLAATAGCASGRAHLEETSPRYAEIAPRRVGVVVAGEAPVDAQVRIDRFGLRYPDPIRPETVLPADTPQAKGISQRLADGLVALLRARGYDATALDGAGRRVGDLLRPDEHDALLVVSYRAAARWPVSEYESTELRPLDSIQQGVDTVTTPVSHYLFDVERGLLILPAAYLFDTRTSLRLWTHDNYGLQSDRVAMDDPVRRMGVVADPGREPPPLDQLVPRAVETVLSFYFDSLPAAPAERPPPAQEREIELREEAAVDRFRERPRFLLDVGGGYARRPFDVGSVGDVTLDGDRAFGGFAEVEAGLRTLGRHLLHGPRVALARSGADYRLTTLQTSSTGAARFTRVSLSGATLVDLSYTVARAWQPRRPVLLAAGLGPALSIAKIDGDPIDHDIRLMLGPVVELEAFWTGEAFLLGPFLRAGWAFDVTEGGSAPTLVAGARAAATF
jgi:hypothetical protein